MFKWIKELFAATKETTETIVQIGVVASMLGGIGYAVGNWFTPKNAFQWVSFFILVCGLLTILVALFFNWRRKRDIEHIPDLIEKLDVLISTYVDDFELELSGEEWNGLNADYSNLLGIDISDLQRAFVGGNEKNIEKAFDTMNRAYDRKLDPNNKTGESLSYLGDMAGILDSYNAGFNRLKVTPQYQQLDKRIKHLQRQAPSAFISSKINDYYTVSEQLYVMILATKPLYEHPTLVAKMPAKVKAKKGQIRQTVNGQVSNLIAGVREAILKHKERNQAESNTESNNKTSEYQNRAARRQRG